MMLEITPDDPGGEMRIDLLGVNVSGFRHYRVLLPHIDGPCWTLLDGLIALVGCDPPIAYQEDFLLNLWIVEQTQKRLFEGFALLCLFNLVYSSGAVVHDTI